MTLCANVHDTLCLFLVSIPHSRGISPAIGVGLLPIPLHLVLLPSEALVVIPFGLEELLEVCLTVDDTLQRSVCASAAVRSGVRVRVRSGVRVRVRSRVRVRMRVRSGVRVWMKVRSGVRVRMRSGMRVRMSVEG